MAPAGGGRWTGGSNDSLSCYEQTDADRLADDESRPFMTQLK